MCVGHEPRLFIQVSDRQAAHLADAQFLHRPKKGCNGAYWGHLHNCWTAPAWVVSARVLLQVGFSSLLELEGRPGLEEAVPVSISPVVFPDQQEGDFPSVVPDIGGVV